MTNVFRARPSLVFKAVETTLCFKPTLDSIEEKSVSCLFTKAIHKLSVIQHLLPYSQATWVENYNSMPLRMTTLIKITLPEDEEDDYILQLKKIQRCRFFLQNIFEETIRELSFQGTYYFLEYILCCESLSNYDNILVKQDNLDLKQLMRLFSQKIVNVRDNFKNTLLYFSEMTGPCLERAVINALVQAEIAMMQTELSQQARLGQNNYRLREKENLTSHTLEKCNEEIEEGNKVSLEIENHILLMTNKLQKKFDKWTKRYNEEIESLDIALLQIKGKLDEQRNQYQSILELYNERQEQVDLMVAEADLRDQEMEIKHVRNKAATVIQAWWRRYLLMRFIKKRIALKSNKQLKESKKPKSKKNKSRK